MLSFFCYNVFGDNMKIMIASDIHGSVNCLDKLMNAYLNEKPDKMIFLGDMFYGYFEEGSTLERMLHGFDNSIFIRGNCDRDVECLDFGFMKYYYFEAFNKKIFCSHGHIYNKDCYPDVQFDVLIGGHTHRGMILKQDNKLFLNPGSVSYPRGESVNSYMIIDDSGIYLKDLVQNIIEKTNW